MKAFVKKEITVSATAFRAADNCKAKGDIRYYLNGVYLDKNGAVVSTDGSMLFKAAGHVDSDSSLIVDVKHKIPKKADTLRFRILDDEEGIVDCLHNGAPICSFYFEIINGKFPNYEDVIAANDKDDPVSEIGVNPTLLQLASKVMGGGSKMKFGGQGTAIKVTPIGGELAGLDAEIYLMPMRL